MAKKQGGLVSGNLGRGNVGVMMLIKLGIEVTIAQRKTADNRRFLYR